MINTDTLNEKSSVDSDQIRITALLTLVGKRVRAIRQQQRMSRRVLSEKSGVSSRYLVLLENGQGNSSLTLLSKVAHVLGKPLEWFVAEDTPLHEQSAELVVSFRQADADQRLRVINILEPAYTGSVKRQRVCLIGLRGAGKSSLGAKLGQRLSVPFVELNQEIEQLSGMSVGEVINLYGQDGYRALETQAIEKMVVSHERVIMAAAGGIVSSPDSYKYLLKHFHTVWLKATPDEHMERVLAQGDKRPMADNPEAMQQLRSLLTSREVLYSHADCQLDTSGQTLEYCQQELAQLVEALLESSVA